jgi:hypothetical protein
MLTSDVREGKEDRIYARPVRSYFTVVFLDANSTTSIISTAAARPLHRPRKPT